MGPAHGPAVSGFDPALTAEVADLLYREAALLDDRAWDAWLSLYTPDCTYWAPALDRDGGFTADPETEISLIYLDRAGLEARVFRIESGDSYANTPLPMTAHLISNVRVTEAAQQNVRAAASWLVQSFRRTDGPIARAGRYHYRLRREGAELRIARKTVYVLDDRIVGPIDIFNI